MFKPSSGDPVVVIDGAACATTSFGADCKNFEGIEIEGTTLYTFVKDPGVADSRALVGFSLDSDGIWDGSDPAVELGGFAADPARMDGADELDIDESTGHMYGTNMFDGELIRMVSGTASVFVDASDILASTGNLSLLNSRVDGVRADGEGYLVLASLDGLLLSVDIAGVLAGVDDADVRILYDSRPVPAQAPGIPSTISPASEASRRRARYFWCWWVWD